MIKVTSDSIEQFPSGKCTKTRAFVGVTDESDNGLPVLYSRLGKIKNPTSDDQYSIVFLLDSEKREALVTELGKIGAQLAKAAGIDLGKNPEKKAELILKAKIKEVEDGFRFGVEQKAAFPKSDGEVNVIDIPVVGPDNEPLDRPFLAEGSRAMANFYMEVMEYDGSVKFPFRLVAVKVTEVVRYEKEQTETPKRNVTDFSKLESDY